MTIHALIRQLSPRHYNYFRALREEALRASPMSYSSDVESWQNAPKSTIENLLRASEESGGHRILGAFTDELVGMIGLNQPKSPKVRHCVTLWGLYVKPKLRGNGIARALLETAIETACQLPEVQQIRMMTPHIGRANDLYSSVGFQKYGQEPKARLVDGEFIDIDYLMLARPVTKKADKDEESKSSLNESN